MNVQPDSRILIIGIGNEWRSDDGIGLDIARNIENQSLPGVHVVYENRDGISLDEVWRGWKRVIVADAMCSGAQAGTILRIDANQTHLKPGAFPQSVHSFGLAEAVELSRVLGEMPSCLVVYGIEGKQFGHGDRISPEVRDAGEVVTARILHEIRHLQISILEQNDA